MAYIKIRRKNNMIGGNGDDANKFTETVYDAHDNCAVSESDEEVDYVLTKYGVDINNLFDDDSRKIIAKKCDMTKPSSSAKNKLRKQFENELPVKSSEVGTLVNVSSAFNRVIEDAGEESVEGNKIMNWLAKEFSGKDSVVNGLKMYIDNGYVHIVRKGWSACHTGISGIGEGDDVIKKEHVGELKFNKFQYGIPIQYGSLRKSILHNEFQNDFNKDIEQKEEAERILAQEYLVGLQPEPSYIMWVLKRLIECWYIDDVLQDNVRKIKLLINQYRAKGSEEFNQKHGILPIIVVYPRYGLKSAELVIKKILYYFWRHMTIGWKCSNITYFIKVNNLIYYTNGLIDLKMYHRKVLEYSKKSINNDTFNDTYTKLNKGKRVEYEPNVAEEIQPIESRDKVVCVEKKHGWF